MSPNNQAISEYLLNYCKTEYAPKFSVLISGDWGSGKTWFITEEFAKQLNSAGVKFIYISLYGLSKTSEIDQEIFKELHPNLSSKHMKLLGKITKGLIQASFKIDLNNDKNDDGNVTYKIPDIEWSDFLKDSGKHILIFDDLERCSIPMDQLLGYLNYFVEHGDHKQILIANESEINCSDIKQPTEQQKNYLKIKEKLIGKTFKIEPEIDQAIDKFLDEVKTKKLNEYRELIKKVYGHSTYKNLRNLRQAILELSQILNIVEKKYLAKTELVSELIVEYLILNFETRNGNLRIDEIKDLTKNLSIIKYANKQDPELLKIQELERKYIEVNWQGNLLPDALWHEIFTTGYLENKKINSNLNESKYFAESNIPPWRKLWNFYQLNDDEVIPLLDDVMLKFENQEFEDLGELKHVTGILLELSDLAICKKTFTEIISTAKAHTTKLLELNFSLQTKNHRSVIDGAGSNGLAFHKANDVIFKEFLAFVESEINRIEKANRPQKAKELLELFKKSPSSFTQALILSNTSESEFYKTPILSHIEPTEFLKSIEEGCPNVIRPLSICLRERYRLSVIELENLIPELDWLKEMGDLLNQRSIELIGTIKGFQLKTLADNMQNSLSHFNVFDIKGEKS